MGGFSSFFGSGGHNQQRQGNTSSFDLPDWYNDIQEDNVNRAWELTNQPFERYPTEERFAPLTEDEQAAFEQFRTVGEEGLPYLREGADMLSQAGNRAFQGPTTENIQSFMNPFQQAFTDVRKREAVNDFDATRRNILSQAAHSDAFGGSGRYILEAKNYENIQDRWGDIQKEDMAQNFYNAQNQFNTANQMGMAAGTQLGNMGSTMQNYFLQGANALLGSGQQQRAYEQQQRDFDFSEFMREYQQPYEQIGFMSNVINSVPLQMFPYHSSGTTSQQNRGNVGSGIAGLVGGFLSDERTKENKKKVGEMKDGTPIYTYNYKGNPMTHMGVMAQDIEKKTPEAVGERGGYKTVDYSKIKRYSSGGEVKADVQDPVGAQDNPFLSLAELILNIKGSNQPSPEGMPQVKMLEGPEGNGSGVGGMLGSGLRTLGSDAGLWGGMSSSGINWSSGRMPVQPGFAEGGEVEREDMNWIQRAWDVFTDDDDFSALPQLPEEPSILDQIGGFAGDTLGGHIENSARPFRQLDQKISDTVNPIKQAVAEHANSLDVAGGIQNASKSVTDMVMNSGDNPFNRSINSAKEAAIQKMNEIEEAFSDGSLKNASKELKEAMVRDYKKAEDFVNNFDSYMRRKMTETMQGETVGDKVEGFLRPVAEKLSGASDWLEENVLDPATRMSREASNKSYGDYSGSRLERAGKATLDNVMGTLVTPFALVNSLGDAAQEGVDFLTTDPSEGNARENLLAGAMSGMISEEPRDGVADYMRDQRRNKNGPGISTIQPEKFDAIVNASQNTVRNSAPRDRSLLETMFAGNKSDLEQKKLDYFRRGLISSAMNGDGLGRALLSGADAYHSAEETMENKALEKQKLANESLAASSLAFQRQMAGRKAQADAQKSMIDLEALSKYGTTQEQQMAHMNSMEKEAFKQYVQVEAMKAFQEQRPMPPINQLLAGFRGMGQEGYGGTPYATDDQVNLD